MRYINIINLFRQLNFWVTIPYMKEIPKAYNPKAVENKIYQLWENSGYFDPDELPGKRTKHFSISLPPPNVTGKLHIGHSAMLAYQDIMIRFHRMQGDRTLWLPGMDHAAIATQNIVERELKKEGQTRHDLGREKFLARIDDFVAKSKDTIKMQLKAMGASLDWSREQFTLSPELTKTVRIAFKKMYDDGLIYRGDRVVNWCPHCQSTLADDEVEYKEEQGKLYYLKYGPVAIATTRPETKLGDTGLAVNPQDRRYQKLLGKELEIDLAGHKIKVKVFADKAVDMQFGTGAIGVTPAHSLQDYQWAQKYNLGIIKVIDEQGKMTSFAGKYSGLDVLTARKKFVENLTKAGLIEKAEDYNNNLSICYRCGTPVEPLPSKQWFVNVNKKTSRGKSLKQLASEAVKSGQIKMIPDKFTKTYFQWMDNLRDWCISRQIWYGHQIPVWYKNSSGLGAQSPRQEEVIVPKHITELVLMRHGITDWNKENKVQGITNVPLDELSIDEIKKMIPRLKRERFDLIITSPLMRAKQTAEIINEELKIPLAINDLLKERNYGEFEGRNNAELRKEYPDYFEDKINFDIPGNQEESYQKLAKRVKTFLKKVSQEYSDKKILVICHHSVIRTFRMIIDHWDAKKLTAYSPKFNELVNYKILDGDYKMAELRQDPDTLDTWFSSGLWTFSTLGWPEKTKDLKEFHPTSVMETGYDILFFWVARMIIMTTYLIGERPFDNVYLHGLIRTKEGKKMSKSDPETAIDPLDMINQFGSDALRLSLVIGTSAGNDVRIYKEKIEGYRNFVNKLWNISRFILSTVKNPAYSKTAPRAKTLSDQWILGELEKTTELVTKKITRFEFSQAGEQLRHFTWDELADWYLEIAKIEGGKDKILLWILKRILILWHPFIPFVTEEIWQIAFGEKAAAIYELPLLMIEPWPKPQKTEAAASKRFSSLQNVINSFRNFRAEYNIPPTTLISVSAKKNILIKKEEKIINKLARVKFTDVKKGIHLTYGQFDFIIPLGELIDVKKEKKRSELELEIKKKYYESLKKKLSNKQFVEKAPKEIVQREREKQIELEEIIKKLKKKITTL